MLLYDKQLSQNQLIQFPNFDFSRYVDMVTCNRWSIQLYSMWSRRKAGVYQLFQIPTPKKRSL